MSGFESCSSEQIRAALPYLSDEEKADLAQALEAKEHDELDARCCDDPLYWAQHLTMTENPKFVEMSLPFKAPFPKKSYFRPLFDVFKAERRLMIPKTRDMLSSWSAMIWATHQAQWFSAFTIVQSLKESKAQELVDYAAILYRNQPNWLQAKHPLAGQNANEVRFENGGRVMGVPAGEHQIRTFHPTCYIVDEAAFLPEAQECWDTVNAAGTPQMIAISSAGPGWFADECQQRAISAAPLIPQTPRPEPILEPEAQPEKSVEEQLEDFRARVMNPVSPSLAEFTRRRDEEQLRQAESQDRKR